MTIGLLFWILYIIFVVLGFAQVGPPGPSTYVGYGRALVFAVLIGLLGWRVFGPAIHG
jgi:hypothetical protein